MLTEVIAVDAAQPDAAGISSAASCLRRGGLVAFPTETVYGLGVHALDRRAVLRLFKAKGRPANDPLIVHVSTFAEVTPLVVEVPSQAALLAARFWPGSLTLIMRRRSSVPPEVSAGLDTVAIRVPAHPVAQALLQAAGIPIAAPSANLFSRPSPTCAEHVLDDLDGRIDMVIDGGPTSVGVESTVLDLTVDPPIVLRPGAITLERIKAVVPTVTMAVVARSPLDEHPPAASPGLLSKHYAPRAPVTLYCGDPTRARQQLLVAVNQALAAGQRVGILATTEDARGLHDVPAVLADLGSEGDVKTVATRLYAALRELDAARVERVFARDIARNDGLWRAIGDRLRRAATTVVEVTDR